MEVQSIAISGLQHASLGDMQKPLTQAVQPLPVHMPALVSVAGDVATALVGDIAAPAEIAQVAALLEPHQSADVASRIAALSSDTASALQVGDHARALSNVTAMAALDPHAVEPLRTEKLLEPIRTEVDQVLNRLTTVAKMNAEGWLAQADDTLALQVHAVVPNVPAALGQPPPQISSPILNPGTVLTALETAYGQSTSSAEASAFEPIAPPMQPISQPSAFEQIVAPPAPQHSPEIVARITELTLDTALALRQGDRVRAFANVTEIAALDPQAVEVLRTDKLFASVRPEANHLLTRLLTADKTDPEPPASADGTSHLPDHASLPALLVKPETLLHVAHRLFDSGGYANYVRSADLAQSIVNPLAYSAILEQYAAAAAAKPLPGSIRLEEEELLPKTSKLVIAGQTLTALRTSAAPRLQTLWRRAPLLVLLLSWLAIGLVGGPASILLRTLWPDSWPASIIDFAFDVWGTGFLALVCFGFYARIRNTRR